jgi:hypothetical protein
MRTSFFLLLAAATLAAQDDAFIGKWDLTVTDRQGGTYPSWLHVIREGSVLRGDFVGRGGNAYPLPEIKIEGGELIFRTSRGGPNQPATVFRGKVKGLTLEGTVKTGDNPELAWTAERAPAWKVPKGAALKKKPGKPVMVFNGKDTTGWLPQDKSRPLGWVVTDGALDNQGKANNIYSEQKFKDFKLAVEFNVAAKSNSGVYLRGRYEIQVLDDAGQPPQNRGQGSIYGFLTPSTNASKPAGEWQSLEATIVGNRVTVVLNGTKIIDDEEIPGITGGAIDSKEAEPGPIMLQGDHGPVKYRKVVVTPLT